MTPVLSDWPMFGLEDDVRPLLASTLAAGRPAVLATLSRAVGGAPFGVGAQMLFGEREATGFLTGGCVEADLALHAAEVFQDGQPRRLIYGEGGPADIRLPCGGHIEVLVEHIGPDDPAAHRLLALTGSRTPALWLSDGVMRACLSPSEPIAPALAHALDEAGGRAASFGDQVARRHDPAQRLIVIGQDPIALAIARLGLFAGWRTILLRLRGPETPPPLPGLTYRRDDDAAHALADLAPDPWTAVVVATHAREDDGAATEAAVRSNAGYVGLLGSRSRLPQRLAGLRAAGTDPRRLDRISAPVGLDIGAVAPREIAVAVVAEIVERAHAAKAASLWAPLATNAA